MENKFVHRLQKTKLSFAEKYCFGNMEEEEVKTFKAIYQKREFHSLRGKEASRFWQKVSSPKLKQNDKLFQPLLDKYQNYLDNALKEVFLLK